MYFYTLVKGVSDHFFFLFTTYLRYACRVEFFLDNDKNGLVTINIDKLSYCDGLLLHYESFGMVLTARKFLSIKAVLYFDLTEFLFSDKY